MQKALRRVATQKLNGRAFSTINKLAIISPKEDARVIGILGAQHAKIDNIFFLDQTQTNLDQTQTIVETWCQRQMDKGLLKDDEKDDIQKRITYSTKINDILETADMVIDSTHHDDHLWYEAVTRFTNPESLFATTLETLNINEVGDKIGPKAPFFLGMNFSDNYKPGLLVEDINIRVGKDTAPQTIYDAMAFAKSLKLLHRVDRQGVEGYDETRSAIDFINLGIAQLDFLLSVQQSIVDNRDKLNPEDLAEVKRTMKQKKIPAETLTNLVPDSYEVALEKVDGSMKTNQFDVQGTEVGPLQLADIIGLDTVMEINRILRRDTSDKKSYFIHPRLREMVEQGHLGKKSGKGFYEYN